MILSFKSNGPIYFHLDNALSFRNLEDGSALNILVRFKYASEGFKN